jgi:hypothetical protein
MRTPSVIEKLQATGYTVRQIPRWELPQSLLSSELKGERWFELTICGHKIWNNQDRNGWFLSNELAEFAAKVPEVKQLSFLEAAHA